MHRAVKENNSTGPGVGDTTHEAVLIGLGVYAVHIGHLNASVRRVIETHWCAVSDKCTVFSNSYWYLCGAHRSYKCPSV